MTGASAHDAMCKYTMKLLGLVCYIFRNGVCFFSLPPFFFNFIFILENLLPFSCVLRKRAVCLVRETISSSSGPLLWQFWIYAKINICSHSSVFFLSVPPFGLYRQAIFFLSSNSFFFPPRLCKLLGIKFSAKQKLFCKTEVQRELQLYLFLPT